MVIENVIFTSGLPKQSNQSLCKATKTKPHFPSKVHPQIALLYPSARYIFFAPLPPLFSLLTTPEKGRNCPFPSPEISPSPATMHPFPASLDYTLYIGVVAPRRDKSCGRVADKFGLRTWLSYLCMWIFGFTCLVFKTTYIDRGKLLRDGAFFFMRRILFPPLDKRNTRDKAKDLCVSSERCVGEWEGANLYRSLLRPI